MTGDENDQLGREKKCKPSQELPRRNDMLNREAVDIPRRKRAKDVVMSR